MKKSILIPIISVLVVLCTAFYTNSNFTDPVTASKYFYFSFACIAFFIIFSIQQFFSNFKTKFNLTWIDVSVLAYVLHSFLRAVTTPSIDLSNINLNILLLQSGVYIIIKPYLKHGEINKIKVYNVFIWGLLLIPSIISIYGILQYFTVLTDKQKTLGIAATFLNPGALGSFLACFVPICLAIYLYYRNKNIAIKWGVIVCSIIILIALILTKSRTAWIASTVGILIVLHSKWNFLQIIQKYLKKIWLKLSAGALSLVLITVISFYLFNLKRDSATGRLFIWKITTEMIKEKPIFGHGFESYLVAHNTYQSDYFENNFNEREAYLADFIDFAFNEYLQIASETGILGLLLFLFILFLSFKGFFNIKKQDNANMLIVMAWGILGTVAVSSLFSYPLRIISTSMLFFFALALISENNPNKIRTLVIKPINRKLFAIILIGLMIPYFLNLRKKYFGEELWKTALELTQSGDHKNGFFIYNEILPVMNYSQYFLYNYGAVLCVAGDYNKSIEILLSVENRLNDANFYTYLGKSYAGLKEYNKAEECFIKASNVVPIKYYPKYLLVKTYLMQNKIFEAKKLAEQILAMPIKVPSKTVDDIRNEMNVLLEELKKNGY